MNEPKQEMPVEAAGEPQADEGKRDAADAGRQGVRRSKTMSRKEMARDLRRRRMLGLIDPEEAELLKTIETTRPRTRADCVNTPRPCMFVACKHAPCRSRRLVPATP